MFSNVTKKICWESDGIYNDRSRKNTLISYSLISLLDFGFSIQTECNEIYPYHALLWFVYIESWLFL